MARRPFQILNPLSYWSRLNGSLIGFQGADDSAEPVSPSNPLPVAVVSGSAGGGGSTDVSALGKEATLAQVRDAVQALAPLLGSTDGLEALAASNRDLLTNLGTYTDGLESLLGTLNTNTDGIESLLSALGVKDDNVLVKLEALRLLLAGTLTVSGSVSVGNFPATQPISAASLPLPAGAATQATLSAVQSLLSPVKTASGAGLTVGAGQVSLTPPAGTTQARVEVVSGAVSWAFGTAGANTGQLATGDALLLSGAEIAALRLTRSGTADAQAYVSYGVIG